MRTAASNFTSKTIRPNPRLRADRRAHRPLLKKRERAGDWGELTPLVEAVPELHSATIGQRSWSSLDVAPA